MGAGQPEPAPPEGGDAGIRTEAASSDAPLSPAEETAKSVTICYERRRAAAHGILETAAGTFLLLIAVKPFEAGPTSKGLIASGTCMGLLLTPLVVHWVGSRGWRASQTAAGFSILGGMGFLAAALFPCLPVFVGGSVLALLCMYACIPLMTQMYQDNYPERERGRLYSSTIMIRIVAAIFFAQGMGYLLNLDLGYYRWMLAIFASAMFFSGFCLSRCPSRPLGRREGAGPFHDLHWIRDDPLFRRTLWVWMFMGIANLIMTPLRVEYLANPKYGLSCEPSTVALMTLVVPNIVRLIVSPLWGYLFDRVNFFRMRIAINIGFALGIITFFTGETTSGLLLGAVFYGIANSGGDLAWSLWVTKIAPANRVAEYMSVHTFLTGTRGVIAPILAFQLAREVSLGWMGLFCSLLIVAATALLIPEARAARFQRERAPVIEGSAK